MIIFHQKLNSTVMRSLAKMNSRISLFKTFALFRTLEMVIN